MRPALQAALREACADVGIVFRDVPVDGRFHATDVDGDRDGRGDGRIQLFADGEGGLVWNWKGQRKVFFTDNGGSLTKAERSERNQMQAEAMRQAEQEDERRRDEAQVKAVSIWKVAKSATADHPYLRRKAVSPVATLREIDVMAVAEILGYAPKSRGESLAGRLLVAPIKVGNKISTAELIDEAVGSNIRFSRQLRLPNSSARAVSARHRLRCTWALNRPGPESAC